jgi:hypothetical protein
MNPKWQALFAAIMQTEETVLPIFIHNAQSQRITGAILVAESIFGAAFGLAPGSAPVPAPVPAPAKTPTPAGESSTTAVID